MSEADGSPRYWKKTETIHLVERVEKSPHPDFEYTVTTRCGIEYYTQSAGFEFDPAKPASEQVHWPSPEAARCGRCSWGEILGENRGVGDE